MNLFASDSRRRKTRAAPISFSPWSRGLEGVAVRFGPALPYLAIALLYAACILLVDPRGEFPLNDDWTYTRSAFRLGLENRMTIDEFSAPNLVGQALYGGLLVKLLGARFLILRLSTLALSCGLACLLWKTARVLGAGPWPAWIAVLSWIFNPIQLCLSFTYMTEIPFLFAIAAAVLAFARHSATRRTMPLMACGAALGYAFLIRQTSILFLASAGFCLAVEFRGQGVRRTISRIVTLSGSAGIFVAAYYVWARFDAGLTPAAGRKFELLMKISTEQIGGNFFGALFYLAFFLLPLLAYLAPAMKSLFGRFGYKAWIPAAGGWAFVSAVGLWWFHSRYGARPYLPAAAFHARMPFLLNTIFDTGLGPITLDPTYYGPAPTPGHPLIWLAVTWLAAAALVMLGLSVTFGMARLLRCPGALRRHPMILFCGVSAVVVILFEIVFSHLQEGGLFDRHLLTAALPLTLLLCALWNGECAPEDGERPLLPLRRRRAAAIATAVAALMLALFAWYGIAGTHDYIAWNRLRWELGNRLLESKVDPLTVSGGFEFNAWHNYDAFRARGNVGKVYYWWYDRLDYLITMEPQEGYSVAGKLEYFSWLHRSRLSVYLLEKISRDNR